MTSSTPPDSKVSVESFARHSAGQMIPVNSSISYFSVIPLEDSELQRLIYDPASASPAAVGKFLPKLRVVIVGYLEEPKEIDPEISALVSFQPPTEDRRLFSAVVEHEDEVFVFIAIKDEDMADSHDSYYHEVASALVPRIDDRSFDKFLAVIREELSNQIRGEIDDRGWSLKEELVRTQADVTQDTDKLRDYAEQALADTLSLYLHGLCCDIDVEAGPRQLASKHIRKRLLLLKDLFPPPKGVALFPDELGTAGIK